MPSSWTTATSTASCSTARRRASRSPLASPAARGARAERVVRPRRAHVAATRTGRVASWPDRSIYELHIGTFTPEGTLDSAIARLDRPRRSRHRLRRAAAGERLQRHAQLGVRRRALVRRARRLRRPGGVPALRRRLPPCAGSASSRTSSTTTSVRAATICRSSVRTCATAERNTWGSSIDLDEPEVRRYIVENALMWMRDHHVDGLRLDAVHALKDSSPRHILQELAEETDALSAHVGRPLTLIAESDLNDATLIAAREADGYGLTARSGATTTTTLLHVAVSGETDRLLRRLRAAVGAGEGRDRRLLPRRQLVVVPRAGARSSDRSADPDLAPGDVQPGSRPDRQPRRGRPALADPRRGRARDRGRADRALAVHPDAVHGRGVGGLDPVAVLHVASRAGARPCDGRGTDRRVRRHGLGPLARSRPQDPETFTRSKLRLGRARRRACTRASSRSTAT